MYNNYYLLKRVKEEEGAISYASVQDDFTFRGEVLQQPKFFTSPGEYPKVGDKVLFLKGSGEDVNVNGETYKVVKFEDIIMKI